MTNNDDRPPGLENEILRQYDDGDQLVDDDGLAYRVVVSRRSNDRVLVREDAVVYDSRLNHPATTGAASFCILLAAAILPIAGTALYLDANASSMSVGAAYLLGGAGFYTAVAVFNKLLYDSLVGEMIGRFEAWYEYKHLLAGREYSHGGEPA